MKINELKLDVPMSSKSIHPFLKSKEYEHLGTGHQAIAYYSKKFPGKAIKTIYISGKNDPQYQFLRVCVNHQNNPYFPKIYAYKMYKAKEFEYTDEADYEYASINPTNDPFEVPPSRKPYVLLVVMEKLIKFDEDNDRILKPLLSKLNISYSEYLDKPSSSVRNKFLDSTFRKKLIASTTDKYFAQALRIMDPLFNKFYPDIHFSNIMIRSNGQVVFVDPFS